ncbi:bifunctional DNA primase/polymerase [Pilimelia anulata]|nr:bifunctional DNA primase/polymerase [Pilimelia anulata]
MPGAQLIDVVRLRRAAARYARRGWTVTPGAWRTGTRFTCERSGCHIHTCHPALDAWQASASTDPATVEGWWRRRPRTVLIATGGAVDVLDVPAHLGLWVLSLARVHGHVLGPSRRPLRGPLAVTPTGRWMFFVAAGAPLRPELDGHPDVLLHARGSWVPAPPTRLLEGPVRWSVGPAEVNWQLPDPYAVQALVADALSAAPARRGALPRLARAAMAA